MVDDVKREPDHQYISQLISEHFCQKIFDHVSDLMYKKSSEEINANEEISENDEPDEDGVYSDQYEEYSEEEGQDNPHQNKHVENRLRREKERKLNELKKWEFP